VTDLVIRPLTAGEEHVFDLLDVPALVGPAAFGRSYRRRAETHEYRPEWTWVAFAGDAVVARAAWWGGPADDEPAVLDWFDFTAAEAGTAVLRAAPLHCEYGLLLPPDWRARPAVRAAAQARIDAVTAAGMRPLAERYNYRWTPDRGLPSRPGRLIFRPQPDDEAILDLLRRIHHGTLDAHARRTIAARGVDAAAREDLAILNWFPSPRDWWRLAFTPAGELVGLVVPARNYTDPVVGLVGVVPEHRGHGYGYDLLVECTHMLVAQGADRVVAATDVTNTPMATAFGRAGYPIDQERIFLA
jgi:RimJ/RimL family protein N-acetyltransferase